MHCSNPLSLATLKKINEQDLEIEESVGNEVQETEGEMRVLKPLSCLIPGAGEIVREFFFFN